MVDVDHCVVAVGEAGVEVVAPVLGARLVDDADGAFQAQFFVATRQGVADLLRSDSPSQRLAAATVP